MNFHESGPKNPNGVDPDGGFYVAFCVDSFPPPNI